jgi:transcriptional regulator with XRE-family HTH domain
MDGGNKWNKNSVLDVLAANVAAVLERSRESGMTLAKRRGPSQKTINNIVKKRHRPTLRSLEKLARALGLEVYQLLCPVTDKDFLIVAEAYNSTDARGRQTLVDNAEILLRRAGRERPEVDEAAR